MVTKRPLLIMANKVSMSKKHIPEAGVKNIEPASTRSRSILKNNNLVSCET